MVLVREEKTLGRVVESIGDRRRQFSPWQQWAWNRNWKCDLLFMKLGVSESVEIEGGIVNFKL